MIFDYGVDERGPYLKALRTYFWLYGAAPIKFNSKDDIAKMAADLRVKILHEAAHLLNIGTSEATDNEADLFAFGAMRAMARDSVFCKFENKSTNPKSIFTPNLQDINHNDIYPRLSSLSLLFHRVYPELAFRTNWAPHTSDKWSANSLFATNFLIKVAHQTDRSFTGTDIDKAEQYGQSISIAPLVDAEGNRTIDIPMSAYIESQFVKVLYHVKVSEKNSEILEAYIEAPSMVQKQFTYSGVSKVFNSDYSYWTRGPNVQIPLSCLSYAAPLKMEEENENLAGQQEIDLKEFLIQGGIERQKSAAKREEERLEYNFVMKQLGKNR